MEIYFSRHAKRQMKWRGVLEDEVKVTILEPEETEDSVKGRKNVFKHVGKKWLKVTFLKVTFNGENDKITVVTVVDKNK